MIGIIDYGMGNLGSVTNALAFIGCPARVLTRPEEFAECAGLILPGVGAFGDGLRHLARHGFVAPIRAWAAADRPLLGVCLGLQALFETSEESPGVAGLGILRGAARKFQLPADGKVPQMGWNRVRQSRPDCPLFRDIPDGAHFYFVHSYYVAPADATVTAGVTDYGPEYTSVAWSGRVFGVQFHPEKSQADGLQLLRNFAARTREAGHV